MKNNVLLVKPDFNDIAILPPLGLGYLAAKLSKEGVSVTMLDNALFTYDDRDLEQRISKINPSIVGISAVTPTIQRAIEIADLVKKVNSGTLVVLGGPHPSCTVEETLLSDSVDVIVIGEGEETFTEIALGFKKEGFDFSSVKGCAFKKHGKIINTPAREYIEDLDSLPFPDFDTMPLDLYFAKKSNFGILQKHSRSLPIIASRGCPSNCTFCQRFMGRRFRARSAGNIFEELKYRNQKTKVSEFNFLDDNFTIDKKLAIEVCDLIIKGNLKISFRFPNGIREDYLDSDLLKALKSAGCYHLDFGLESGSQKVLDIMKKGKKIEIIAEKVRLTKKYGFKVSASFIFGTPGETIDDMKKTIEFAKSLPLDSACFGIVIPFPGTELRKQAVESGYLENYSYAHYNPTSFNLKPLIKTKDWSPEDLIGILKKANRDFFFRPSQVLRVLPSFLNPHNRKRFLHNFKQVFG